MSRAEGELSWGKPPAGGHGYGIDVVSLFLRLVLVANVSLRGASRVLATVGQALGLPLPVPHWTTGRLWLLRLGHAMLSGPLENAGDWAWLVDHSVQIGQEKCLVILGIRLIDLPERGQSLRHEDLELIELLPAKSWTRADVDAALEKASARTGVPRVIVDDHGVDLCGGVALFQQRHPQTAEVYDAKHKAACLLKRRLEGSPRWQEFQTRVGQTRCGVQQTELAFLAPPGPKPKARFMNLGPLLAWATRVLAILREPPPAVARCVSPERLKEKLGWIETFAADLIEWSRWQRVVDLAVALVNEQGIYRGAADLLAARLSQLPPPDAGGETGADAGADPRGEGDGKRDGESDSKSDGESVRQLAAELVEFVRCQEAQARPGERLPGSTEVLESCFGKFKQLEKQQSRGGFTQLLLAFGALVARAATATVRQAMQQSRTTDVRSWAQQTLGTTLFAQRKLAFASATTIR